MRLEAAPAAALAHGRRRPDPALGVFETLLVVDGEAQRLDAHLARLAASLGELYGRALPGDLHARVHALAHTARGRARLRIDVAPDADAELMIAPAGERELPIVLHPYTLPGGLGAHKWRDRALVDALTQTPLLLDADGTVLEAGWANVLIRRGGSLLCPRDDGRILPGTTLPAAEEADLTLADLRHADEILGQLVDRGRGARGARRETARATRSATPGMYDAGAGYRSAMAERQAWDLAFDPATGFRLTQQQVGASNLLPSSQWPNFFSRVVARLQWDARAIDLAPDAAAWPELADERRDRLTTLLAGFRVAEDAVAEHIAPFGEAANNSLVSWVLYLQRRDEQRHAVMFDRIAAEVLELPGDTADERLEAAREHAPAGRARAVRGAAARHGERARGGPHRRRRGHRPLPHDPRGDRPPGRATCAGRGPGGRRDARECSRAWSASRRTSAGTSGSACAA